MFMTLFGGYKDCFACHMSVTKATANQRVLLRYVFLCTCLPVCTVGVIIIACMLGI